MARIRSIKPEFFLNDALAELPPIARLLFVGLWTQADREGRMEYRPKRLKASVLPYDECDIEALVRQLESAGFVTVYEVESERYLEVCNFLRHQVPNVKEKASTVPAPCQHSASTPLIGREGKGREGKAARAEVPPTKSNLPACLTTDSWSRDGGEFKSSFAHIASAFERKYAMPMTPKDIGALGESLKRTCPAGCNHASPERCAGDIIDKIARANNFAAALRFYESDRRDV